MNRGGMMKDEAVKLPRDSLDECKRVRVKKGRSPLGLPLLDDGTGLTSFTQRQA